MKKDPLSHIRRGLIAAVALTFSAFLHPGPVAAAPASFAHPGVFNSQQSFDALREAVASHPEDPRAKAFARMQLDPRASLSYAPQPFAHVLVQGSGSCPEEDAFFNDGTAAYLHALQWVATGKQEYFDKATGILDAWSAVIEDVEPKPGQPPTQDRLEVSWAAPTWVASAEILAFYKPSAGGPTPEWNEEGRKRFRERMVAVFTSELFEGGRKIGSGGTLPNQPIALAYAVVAVGAYLNDAAMFDLGVDAFQRILPNLFTSEGEPKEINRIKRKPDWPHSVLGSEAAYQLAEAASVQGVNLFEYRVPGDDEPRLLTALQWLTRAIKEGEIDSKEMGKRVTWDYPNEVKGMEMALARYAALGKGEALADTREILARQRENASHETQGAKHVPWDAVTHASAD